MKMVPVVGIAARSENGGEIFAAIGPHRLQQRFFAEGEEAFLANIDFLAVLQRDLLRN